MCKTLSLNLHLSIMAEATACPSKKRHFGFLTCTNLQWHMPTLCCTDRSLRFLSSHSGVLLKCCYQAANELIRARGLLQSQVQDDFQQQSKHTMFRKEGHSMHNLSRLHRAIPLCGLKSACCPPKGGSGGQKAKST